MRGSKTGGLCRGTHWKGIFRWDLSITLHHNGVTHLSDCLNPGRCPTILPAGGTTCRKSQRSADFGIAAELIPQIRRLHGGFSWRLPKTAISRKTFVCWLVNPDRTSIVIRMFSGNEWCEQSWKLCRGKQGWPKELRTFLPKERLSSKRILFIRRLFLALAVLITEGSRCDLSRTLAKSRLPVPLVNLEERLRGRRTSLAA